jgi:hypothetical protein
MLVATWILAIATVALAIEGAGAVYGWLASLRVSRRRQETERLARSSDRMAVLLASRQNQEDGNPDDEFFADWYRWLSGDPDADSFEIFIQRKKLRDVAKGQRHLPRTAFPQI